MASRHDNLAGAAGQIILDNIRKANSKISQIFSTNIRRVGFDGWPEPDFVFKDYTLDATFAFEFKPPAQTKREYLTGLGQATAYTDTYTYSGLVVPEQSENFLIADYLQRISKQPELKNIPLCIFKYKNEHELAERKPDCLVLIKEIQNKRIHFQPSKKFNSEKVFWTWWRDTSPTEIFQLLELTSKHHNKSPDIYSDYVWPEFWNMILNGSVKDWEGNQRHIRSAPKSHKQNYKIPLFHLGLIEPSSGELSDFGYDLHKIGKLFGPESLYFKEALAKRLLIEGKHLELILLYLDFQSNTDKNTLSKSNRCFKAFEEYLDHKGLIPKRKPGRTTTSAKNAFIRDEPKLWNKIGMLVTSGTDYFTPNEGLNFNWSKIIKLCVNN